MSSINFVQTGGTILMDNGSTGSKPTYDLRHLLLAVKIQESNLAETKKARLLGKLTELKTTQYDEDDLDYEIANILDALEVRTIYHLMKEYGVSPYVSTPFKPLKYKPGTNIRKDGLLDSINFDFPTHYPVLSEGTKKILHNENTSAIILGGTDSLEFYAPALTNEMERKGRLKNSNIIFLSSMYSFEENPAYVATLVKGALEAAKTVTQQKDTPPLHGGFVISPEIGKDGQIEAVKLHDVSKGLVKISSKLKDPFRSNNGIADVIELKNGKVKHNPSQEVIQSHEMIKKRKSSLPLNVAPPLIHGNSPEVISNFIDQIMYMSYIGEKPFDMIPIEGLDCITKNPKAPELIEKIRKLNLLGVRITFINDHTPEKQFDNKLKPSGFVPHESKSQAIAKLKTAGCLFVSGPTTNIYSDLRSATTRTDVADMLDVFTNNEKPARPHRMSQPIKIKYVPNQQLFKPMLEIASRVSNHIVIESLPGQALPNYYAEPLKKITEAGIDITVGFKYNGRAYNDEKGSSFIEGESNGNEQHYLASKWLEDVGVKFSKNIPPSDIGNDKSQARA